MLRKGRLRRFSERREIGVPLARLRATGRCVEIGEPELAFTDAEEPDMARLLGVSPPGRELAGWPALVRLALTSGRAFTHRFLWEEIIDGLQPSEERGLLALALVGWADEQTISSICGEHVDVEQLSSILQAGGHAAHLILAWWLSPGGE